MSFTARDPRTGRTLRTTPTLDAADLEARIAGAHHAQEGWARTSFATRADALVGLAGLLRDRAEEYGSLMTREMGKPLAQAVAEAEKCAWAAEYYAENTERFLAPTPVETDARTSYWSYRPLGLVLGIMPWNYPFWQAARFAIPTLAAGNGVLLKHAPSVPGCAEALEDLFHEAGFPEGLVTNLFVDPDTAGRLIEEDRRIQGVSLTGSVGAGKAVAARAGAALKPCVLELGGSDPSVILADADLDPALDAVTEGRLQNNGQSCIAAKRIIAVPEVRDAVREGLLRRLEEANAHMGDPMEEGTRLGPMAREDLRDGLHDQVERSVSAGATLELGGVMPQRDGWWYPATLLTDVTPGMAAYDEELFGPVAVLIDAKDEEDALRIANDTRFGLGAAVYTGDAERGERIARDVLEAGNCFVNGMVRSDPRLPFGGIKESGWGRELSPLGIRAFTNVKTVWVA